ncbi:MGH1-like glycoside hydrolase domain-containing protein [Aquihabitans sp. McL0605]|uniref:MGH1-like glycoside hydrolase domain-containing protein n=1 Tax=Aquihabitans sp. McL0605 TaxID=3415671 RepID=UPI003CE6C7FF
MPSSSHDTAEHARLARPARPGSDPAVGNEWYEWGPYLAERAWGSVREDYSESGDAWSSFPHDHARSRAYRWNEDGLAGVSDVDQRLCLSLALWNGRDPILKERIFGLTGPEGNHGEDAKEYWWYLDALPSHAWLRWRYHYPQGEFPYDLLVAENGRRGLHDPEFELLDTGAFDQDRYWSVEVTYAKADPTDLLMHISIHNHGPEAAELHVLPTLWFRNTWDADGDQGPKPVVRFDDGAIRAELDRSSTYELVSASGPGGAPVALFCENETNAPRIFGAPATTAFPKDGINDHVVSGATTVDPAQTGTKAAWWHRMTVAAGADAELRLRLRRVDPTSATTAASPDLGSGFDAVMAERSRDADEYYAAITPSTLDPERAKVVRQASAGLVWSKQYYAYRVARWLDGDPGEPPPPEAHRHGRNAGWRHLDANDILAMPDPWEYPWFAAWDLAFHTIAWAHLDPAFAKDQLLVLLREEYLNPNGALPAYEWSFDDVNPPVHSFAAFRVFAIAGDHDLAFLERAFHKLLINYTWWLNRQDPDGNNLFGGGFLGLDNISPIDRSHLPPGASLVQADGSAWMAFNSLAMLSMAQRLAEHDPVYDDLVVTFVERFMSITRAINSSGLYDPDRGFFYDFIDGPDGRERVEVETIGGAVPLFSAVTMRGADDDERSHDLRRRLLRLLDVEASGIADLEALGRLRFDGTAAELLVSVVTPDQLRTTLAELFDEDAFLSPHGLRALSKRYDGRPYAVTVEGVSYIVDYEPAESTTPMYGGNSNWRGPVWVPVNYLVIRALARFHTWVGPDFTVEYPTGSGHERNLLEVAQDLADRIVSLFVRAPDGHRPVFGGETRFQQDPAWDNLLFFEYFHGDNGAGLGASHQTGWTALVIDLLLDPPTESWALKAEMHPETDRG